MLALRQMKSCFRMHALTFAMIYFITTHLASELMKALALTENAKKIILMLTCFWHCQKRLKLEITKILFSPSINYKQAEMGKMKM